MLAGLYSILFYTSSWHLRSITAKTEQRNQWVSNQYDPPPNCPSVVDFAHVEPVFSRCHFLPGFLWVLCHTLSILQLMLLKLRASASQPASHTSLSLSLSLLYLPLSPLPLPFSCFQSFVT